MAIFPELLLAKGRALAPYSLDPLLEAFPYLALEPLVQALAFLERKYREVIIAQLQFQIAFLGDRKRIFERLGNIGELFCHLFGGFEVELIGLEL